MIAAVAYPRIRKALTQALGNTLDSLPAKVRRQLRGRWRWCVASIGDGRTMAHISPRGIITFDPVFVGELIDAGEQSALEALCCHELGHRLRQLRRETASGEDAEERAVNDWMREVGFGHDLRRLKRLSGYSRTS